MHETIAVYDGTNTDFRVTERSADDVGLSETTGDAFAQIINIQKNVAVDQNMERILGAVTSAEDINTVERAIESLTSDVSGGAVVAGINVSNQTNAITNARLASLRGHGGGSGVSAGDLSGGIEMWVQGYGTQGTQDERESVSGYSVDILGVAFGFDAQMSDNVVAGVAISHSDTQVQSDADDNAETDISGFQVAVYGDYDLTENTFLTGQLGYVMANNKTSRNVLGASSERVTGEFSSTQFNARAELARSDNYGRLLRVTPSVMVNYAHYNADPYSEEGATTGRVSVESDAFNMLEVGAGIEFTARGKYPSGALFEPSLIV